MKTTLLTIAAVTILTGYVGVALLLLATGNHGQAMAWGLAPLAIGLVSKL